MPIARLKEKRQITVPAEICRQIQADTGDMFDFEVDGNHVVMRLQRLVPAGQQKGIDTSSYAGSTKEPAGSVDQTGKKMRPQSKKAQEALAFRERIERAHEEARAKGYDISASLDEEDYYKQYL